MLRMSLRYRGAVVAVLTLGALIAGSRYLRHWLAQPLLDEVLVPISAGTVDMDTIAPLVTQLAVLATIALLVGPIAVMGRGYYSEWISARVRQDVDIQVARKFLRAPLRLVRDSSSGDFLSRAISDAKLACQSVQLMYRDIFLDLEMILGGVILMLTISWQLTLISLVGVPPFVLVMTMLGAKAFNMVTRRQETQGDLSQRLLAILSGIKVIKAFQGEKLEQAAFNREAGKYFRRHMKVRVNAALMKASSELLYPVVGSIVMGIGIALAIEGLWGITIGKLTTFALVLATVYKPIKSLTQAYATMIESASSAERLFGLLDMEEEVEDRPNARPMTGLERNIRFDDVHFDYGGEPVLRGIDLEIQAGEVVAIVGRTGAGKSTLVDLVLRFHDPTRGRIEIDGVDLRDLERRSFLDHIAVVTQEPFLFDETILENIRYGRLDATDEEVRAAAVAASAHEFIETLPEGYHTLAGEFGMRLSGGQRQRITIARAILANPAILVFDEATSALDAQTERAVQTAIEGLRGRRTIFIVAHRLSTIERADRIVVLDRGRVAEVGDHTSLMERGGIYAELIGIQQAQAS